jgi:hypothetical protein
LFYERYFMIRVVLLDVVVCIRVFMEKILCIFLSDGPCVNSIH